MSNPRQAGKSRPKHKKHRRRERKPAPSTLVMIDRLLLGTFRTTVNGVVREMTALEAIMLQLIQKESAGESRASRVLQKYEELTRHGFEAPLQVTFVGSDYIPATSEVGDG